MASAPFSSPTAASAQQAPTQPRGQPFGQNPAADAASWDDAARTRHLMQSRTQTMNQQNHHPQQQESQQPQHQQYQAFNGAAPTSHGHQNQQRNGADQSQLGGPSTAPFLRDFNLVAEAAKRAEMAVLMRDLEGVGL